MKVRITIWYTAVVINVVIGLGELTTPLRWEFWVYMALAALCWIGSKASSFYK